METRYAQNPEHGERHNDATAQGGFEFDIVIVGLNIQTLALAVALLESYPSCKVLILEKKSREQWTPISHSAPRTMDSFLHDLITLHNPRSHFTFMNYLHKTKQLVVFTNVSQIKPSREQFTNYLRWVASHFESYIRFQVDVISMNLSTHQNETRDFWRIDARQKHSEQVLHFIAQKIVLLTSPQRYLPVALSLLQNTSSVIHAAGFQTFNVRKVLQENPKSRFAIYGKNAQAVSIFLYLQSIYGMHYVTWVNPASRVTAAGGKPISTAAFIIEGRSEQSALPPELRPENINATSTADEVTKVSRQQLDEMYERLYGQSIFEADQARWQFRIETGHELIAASRTADGRVMLRTISTQNHHEKEELFDVVISATGFVSKDEHNVLAPIQDLLDQGRLTVDSDYRVNFNKMKVTPDLGMWCIGSLEPNTMPEERMTIVAERAHRVVNSIRKLEQENSQTTEEKQHFHARGRL